LTLEIVLVLTILAVAVLLLVTEWIPLEVTALLCLGTVALTGLVSPVEALSGFSNPAVVTIWAVFILSGGLTRTGVAKVLGNFVLKLAGAGESSMIIVIMLTAGLLSAIMNNVAVAALMLPVVIDIARQTGRSPSRLLMPLAYGSLLGGLTTQIGTPPNILVTDALRDAGLKPFTFFDFTPVGLVIMFTGIFFMAFIGRHLLPDHDADGDAVSGGKNDWQNKYDLQERLFHVRVPQHSVLVGKSLGQVRLGSILGWYVIAIRRRGKLLRAPGPADTLQAGDLLTVKGRVDAGEQLQNWRKLDVEEDAIDLELPYSGAVKMAEVTLSEDSHFIGSTLNSLSFRNRFGLNVLAIRRADQVRRFNLSDEPLADGDQLLVARYHLHDRLMVMQIPADSALVNQTLHGSRLGYVLGSRFLGILRDEQPIIMPEPGEILQAGDRLVVEGHLGDLEYLAALEELEVVQDSQPEVEDLLSGSVSQVEAILSPQTTLEGKTLRQINFREKFGLNVLALWRRGRTFRSDLRDIELRFGDSLLLLGPRDKLRLVGREPDFIGWVPIYIAAVVGAALMVLTGCLTMEEAYRQIEWKAVFLIAGMLPLGTALDQTGAARMIADGVVALVGPLGPGAIMFALISLTFMATCFVPTAALIVLMAPIVFNTAADMGLSPHALVMAVAMAASASFMTPVSHPANILVMGPGGYRFKDYLLIGGLLTLLTLGVLMLVMPFFWPLTP
jgi:di/tricarboxylate transporter